MIMIVKLLAYNYFAWDLTFNLAFTEGEFNKFNRLAWDLTIL